MNNEPRTRISQSRKHHKLIIFVVLVIIVYLISNIYINLGYQIKSPYNPKQTLNLSFKPQSQPTWVSNAESAMAIDGHQILTSGSQKPLPTASTAKLITSLVVLKARPISPGHTGPIITMTPADVAIYNNYVSKDGSVIPIVTGENLNEYQILEGMLLPSADNLADILATWAYGSLSRYSQVANQFLKANNINHTHVGTDASGYSPTTVSTAKDLVKIGELVMKNPILAQIVDEKNAYDIPVAGTIHNLNYLLGADYIVGIKTGSTGQAGGVFVGAANYPINNKTTTIITAIMGTPDLNDALIDSSLMFQQAEKAFSTQQVISPNQVVANLNLPWGGQAQLLATKKADQTTWYYSSKKYQVKIPPIKINKTYAGQKVGDLILTANSYNPEQTIPLKLAKKIQEPLWWTIFHFNF